MDDEMEVVDLDDTEQEEAAVRDLPPVDVQPVPRRRRRSTSATINSLGGAARASTTNDPAKAQRARERSAESQRLLGGGKSKGEQKGYGVAGYRQR